MNRGTRDWPRPILDHLWRTAGRVMVDVGQVFFAALPTASPSPTQRDLIARAKADLARMRREPVPVVRPVLLLNGYHAWAGVIASLRRRLIALTSRRPRDFVDVSFFTRSNFPAIREDTLRELARTHGEQAQVDVIGVSMGGLVARLVASPHANDARVVHAARIFTIATPHRGANLARHVRPNATAKDMHPEAGFITGLNERVHPELRCYAQTHDNIVGATNTAPPGVHPFWFPGPALMSHFTAQQHPVILADIARHLRGEEPLLSAGDASMPPRD